MTSHTSETIVDIYTKHKNGMKIPQIAREENMGYASVYFVLQSLEKYLKGDVKKFKAKNYVQAVKIINAGKPEVAHMPETQQPEMTAAPQNAKETLQRLENAFTNLQTTMLTVIELEAKRKAQMLVQEQQEKYNQVIGKLKAEIEEVKKQEPVSVFDQIKKSWGLT